MGMLKQRLQFPECAFDKTISAQKIHRGVAGEHKLWAHQQVRSTVNRLVKGVLDELSVPAEVTDRRIELRDRDLH